jgi:ATP-dependent Lon protease
VLSGASSQWKNAKPGKVFDTFLNGDYANPVIVVDELDKASADGSTTRSARSTSCSRSRPRRASSTSSSSCRSTPRRGLARHRQRPGAHPRAAARPLDVYEIDAPDEAARAPSRSHLRDIRDSHDWGRQFPGAPSASALDKLRSLAPREMRRALQPRSATPSSPGAASSVRTTSHGRAPQAEDRLFRSSQQSPAGDYRDPDQQRQPAARRADGGGGSLRISSESHTSRCET